MLTALALSLLLMTGEPVIKTDPVPVQYVGTVSFDSISVRVLILKHAFEAMASGDANLVIEATNLASNKGMHIQDIGNFFINQDGKVNPNRRKIYMSGLKDFVKQQAKVNAEAGDTLVIFTVGHGGQGGELMNLGQRNEIMKILADVAEENEQEILWWQLSCHASARLPSISSLNSKQQELFSIVASSSARDVSPAYVEGHIMEKVFVAMATNDRRIDPDGDEVVTAKELAAFLDTVEKGRGKLVYARSVNEPIFGANWMSKIPVIDQTNFRTVFPKKFIPLP